MPGVSDSNGLCDANKFVPNWHRNMGIYDYLCAIRSHMVQASKLKQPPLDSTYA